MLLKLADKSPCNHQTVPSRALLGIHKAIFNNPKCSISGRKKQQLVHTVCPCSVRPRFLIVLVYQLLSMSFSSQIFNCCNFLWNICTVVSRKNALPLFATLALVQSAGGGACTRDATFSLARLRPPFRCLAHKFMTRYIEDNTFDNFAVAIWMLFIHVAVPCRNRRLLRRVFQSH